MKANSLMPFDQIKELSSYASSIVLAEPLPPRISWDDGMTTVAIDGEHISLDFLRQGIQEEIRQLESCILALTGEQSIPDWLSKDDGGRPVKDEPRNRDPGYSFLDDSRFRDRHHPFLRHLVEDPEWNLARMDVTQKLVKNMVVCHRVFDRTEEIQEKLLVLIHIFSHCRGTELAETKIQNSASRLRNLAIYHDRLYNNISHTKTSQSTGHDSYLPCLLPAEISRLLVHYLVVIRPVEVYLSLVLWGEQTAALYTTYLFVARQRRLTASHDSAFLEVFFNKHCDAHIQLNRWRQVSASLKREFINEKFLSACRRSDSSMGHTMAVSRKYYAQDHDTPEFATSDILFEQTWVDRQLHALLGLGSETPPLPQRFQEQIQVAEIGKIGASVTACMADLREIKAAVMNNMVGGSTEAIRATVTKEIEAAVVPAMKEMRRSFLEEMRRSFAEEMKASLAEMRRSLVHDVLQGVGDLIGQRGVTPPGNEWDMDNFYAPAATNDNPQPEQKPRSKPKQEMDDFLTEPEPTAKRQPGSESDFNPWMSGSEQPTEVIDISDTDDEDGRQRTEPVPRIKSETINLMLDDIPENSTERQKQELRWFHEADVLHAIRRLHGDDAKPRSDAQLELCTDVMLKAQNVVGVLPTGSGKSMAWLVASFLDYRPKSDDLTVVVVPFKELLLQHVKTAEMHRLDALHWRSETGVVSGATNLLFVACETIESNGFKK